MEGHWQDDERGSHHDLDSLRDLHARRSLTQPSLSSYSRKLTEANNVEFFAPLADELKCPVCQALMNGPQLTSCGHRFCKDCIDPIKQEPNPECPICNEPEFKMMADRALERKIKALKIYCLNREGGCRWIGELATLDDHLEQQCNISVKEVSCKFESLGCKERISERELDAHISGNLLGHVTMFMEQFEAQQKAFQHIFDENAARIQQVERQIDRVEESITQELNNKSYIKWSPVDFYRIFELKAGTQAGVQHYHIPDSLVPNEAKEFLLLVVMQSGNTYQVPMSTHCMSLFVEEAGVHHAKYLHFTTYKQDAWNNNTENMWLPMPSDRTVHLDVPIEFKNNIRCNIFLTGYR